MPFPHLPFTQFKHPLLLPKLDGLPSLSLSPTAKPHTLIGPLSDPLSKSRYRRVSQQLLLCVVIIFEFFFCKHVVNISVAGTANPDYALVNLRTIKILLVLFVLVPRPWDEMMFCDFFNLSIAKFAMPRLPHENNLLALRLSPAS